MCSHVRSGTPRRCWTRHRRRPRAHDSALRVDWPPRRLRVGVSRQSTLGEPLHPGRLAAVDDAAELLASLGHRVVELELPFDGVAVAGTCLTIVAAAVAGDVRAPRAKTGRIPRPALFVRPTWFLKQVGEALSARELAEANDRVAVTARSLGGVFGTDIDVHLSATMAAPPVRVGELGIGVVEKAALSVLQRLPAPGAVLRQALNQVAHESLEKTPNTQPFNLTGQPAMSLPPCWNRQNLPIGVQIAAAFGADELLLRLAQQVHDARPWFGKHPDVRS